MAEMVKLFRANVGDEASLAESLAAFYNRQGRIGNRIGNAKILSYADNSIGISVPYSGIVDDGRQIDDIEDRKSFLIYRTGDCDTTSVDKFIADHTEAGDDVSRPYICTIGNDTLYFVAACKIVPHADSWSANDDADDDDWTPSGNPTMASDNESESGSGADIAVTEDTDEADPFN